jgi:hypothetical protein
MKIIETIYNGNRFRSRLEARWAVFFDALGVPYEYEKEGYNLDEAGCYLPDFWLPQQQGWVEIKGPEPTDSDALKACALAYGTKEPVFVFVGEIRLGIRSYFAHPAHHPSKLVFLVPCFAWAEAETSHCPCGRFAIHRVPDESFPFGLFHHGYKLWFDSPRLHNAYTAARQARFEHYGAS